MEERFVIESRGERCEYIAGPFVPGVKHPKRLGMSGTHYVIRRVSDGRLVHTNDLWYQKPTTAPVTGEFVHIELPPWGESACHCFTEEMRGRSAAA